MASNSTLTLPISLERTCAVAWAPGTSSLPQPTTSPSSSASLASPPPTTLVALGTVAGAMDASFSAQTTLELWDLSRPSAPASAPFPVPSRFNRLVWGSGVDSVNTPWGLLAGGLEGGDVMVWNPKLLLSTNAVGDSTKGPSPIVLKQKLHTGQVRGLAFNPSTPSLLASGGLASQIFVWDMARLSQQPLSLSDGNSSTLEDISCLGWNHCVSHILAAGSTNGITAIFDTRAKREVMKLSHPAGRRLITDLSWNPSHPTQLVTCSNDDANPVIYLWDLKNASAPDRALSGHTKGVLSVAWCPKDSELLLSSGKDNRTLVWNPASGDCLGDLSVSSNWAFESKWCPRNPDLISISSFDGTVKVISLQSPSEAVAAAPSSSQGFDGQHSIYDAYNQHQVQPQTTPFRLARPPAWMARTCSCSWSFGGKLITFRPSSRGVVNISVPSDQGLHERLLALESFTNATFDPIAYCQLRADSSKLTEDRDLWRFMGLMFAEGSRSNMLDYLGLSKGQMSGKNLEALLKTLCQKASADKASLPEVERNASIDGVISDTASEAASSTTNPGAPNLRRNSSLFLNTDSIDAALRSASLDEIPHTSTTPFSLYGTETGTHSSGGSDVDALITSSLLLGDFDTAIDICLASADNRIADALMFATYGGPQHIARVRAEFFRRHSAKKPYSRILDAVVNGNLQDIVRNAALVDSKGAPEHWKHLMALICTFAKAEDFKLLCGILARRLDLCLASASPEAARKLKSASLLCYVGSADLGKVTEMWLQQLGSFSRSNEGVISFVEKVSVYQRAIGVDPATAASVIPIPADVTSEEEAAQVSMQKLLPLYHKYAEYAETLASKGRFEFAWRMLELIPKELELASSPSLLLLRDRIFNAHSKLSYTYPSPPPAFESVEVVDAESMTTAASYGTGSYGTQAGYAQQPSYYPGTAATAAAPSYPNAYGGNYGQPPVALNGGYGSTQATNSYQPSFAPASAQGYASSTPPIRPSLVPSPSLMNQPPSSSYPAMGGMGQQQGYGQPAGPNRITPSPMPSFMQAPLPPPPSGPPPVSFVHQKPNAGFNDPPPPPPSKSPSRTDIPAYGQSGGNMAQLPSWMQAPSSGGAGAPPPPGPPPQQFNRPAPPPGYGKTVDSLAAPPPPIPGLPPKNIIPPNSMAAPGSGPMGRPGPPPPSQPPGAVRPSMYASGPPQGYQHNSAPPLPPASGGAGGYRPGPPPSGYQSGPPPPPSGFQPGPPPTGYQSGPPPSGYQSGPPSGYQSNPPQQRPPMGGPPPPQQFQQQQQPGGCAPPMQGASGYHAPPQQQGYGRPYGQ